MLTSFRIGHIIRYLGGKGSFEKAIGHRFRYMPSEKADLLKKQEIAERMSERNLKPVNLTVLAEHMSVTPTMHENSLRIGHIIRYLCGKGNFEKAIGHQFRYMPLKMADLLKKQEITERMSERNLKTANLVRIADQMSDTNNLHEASHRKLDLVDNIGRGERDE
ncbi:hypothetical protein [Alkalihalobacillus sp. LMS39]|uniref:hypothetical protein n=1 Tax=Alkalihalobacillus sp. LMS39 TaxID=2924032 RepID=UPI001FB45157|nr:hypothetical protein [Alkalihalobacillus sp. LMS39]UOE92670.1 hypothetical protein MM271_15675 [Alkalihalobacillus sp. LMS39]